MPKPLVPSALINYSLAEVISLAVSQAGKPLLILLWTGLSRRYQGPLNKKR